MSNINGLTGNDRAAYIAKIRAAVQAVRDGNGDNDPGVPQAQIARESAMSGTVISQFLSDSYKGDNFKTAQALDRWLDARDQRQQVGATMPQAPAFVMTPTAQRIYDALTYAHLAEDISMIYGTAGMSKTQTIRHYADSNTGVYIATITPATATVPGALEEIAATLHTPRRHSVRLLHRDICTKLANTKGLIIIDEAQHLTEKALDQVRAIHDETEIGIALVGNETVFSRMTGGNRAAYLDRLYSRIGKRVRVVAPSGRDVKAIANAWGVTDATILEQLTTIAMRPGALRNVTKALRLASMLASGAGAPLSPDHVRAAWRDLGGES